MLKAGQGSNSVSKHLHKNTWRALYVVHYVIFNFITGDVQSTELRCHISISSSRKQSKPLISECMAWLVVWIFKDCTPELVSRFNMHPKESWTHRICSSSWGRWRLWLHSDRVSNCVPPWPADGLLQSDLACWHGWTVLKYLVQMCSPLLLVRLPNHICHRDLTTTSHTWLLRAAPAFASRDS